MSGLKFWMAGGTFSSWNRWSLKQPVSNQQVLKSWLKSRGHELSALCLTWDFDILALLSPAQYRYIDIYFILFPSSSLPSLSSPWPFPCSSHLHSLTLSLTHWLSVSLPLSYYCSRTLPAPSCGPSLSPWYAINVGHLPHPVIPAYCGRSMAVQTILLLLRCFPWLWLLPWLMTLLAFQPLVIMQLLPRLMRLLCHI